MGQRKTIPPTIKELVLIEAGFKCANPTCRHILTLEMHHILWVKNGGTNDPDNLLALCPNCHEQHTRGYISETAIRKWKQLLLSLNTANRATADLLLVLYDEECRVDAAEDAEETAPQPFRFTGDSLPALAGLITSGLLTISRRYVGIPGRSIPSFDVRLTEKGRHFVDEWRTQDG